MEKVLLIILGVMLFCGNAVAQENMSAFVGEQITYTIKQLGVKAGEAVLSYEGPASKDDKDYVLILFKADGLNFYDFEKIYADPVTLTPRIVERDLNIFGSKEQITEYYDPQSGEVRVVKTVSGKTTEQVIEKKGEVDNIYCFIYRYRKTATIKVGEVLNINLPTTDLKIKAMKMVSLSAAGKKFDAVFLQSDPSKYKLWFDGGVQKIPLRIDGAVGVGSTVMIMKSYESKKAYVSR